MHAYTHACMFRPTATHVHKCKHTPQQNTYTVKFVFQYFIYSLWEFSLPYFARAVLPILFPAGVCSISLCPIPDSGMAASAWDL